MVALSQAGVGRLGVLVGKAVVVHSFVLGVVEGGAECSAAHSQIGLAQVVVVWHVSGICLPKCWGHCCHPQVVTNITLGNVSI